MEYYLILITCLGLIVGSFLNVVIYRLPIILQRDWRSQCVEFLELTPEPSKPDTYNLLVPRSRCQHCKALVHAWHNIPIISFLFLKGKCANCAAPISKRYPLIEFITALLTLFIAWQFAFSWQAVSALILTWSLICLAVIDFDHKLLPDDICLPMIWLGLLLNSVGVFTDLQSAVIGAVVGYSSLWLFTYLFKLATGKMGMGHGDFKLFALFGAWLGWQQLPAIILIASIVGSIVGVMMIIINKHDRNKPIPFGPFLALGGWLALVWGQQLTHLYLTFTV